MGRSLRSNRRSGWPAKPHFPAAILMTRHGTAGFYRVWRSHFCLRRLSRKFPAFRALSAPPSSPRTRPDRGLNCPMMAPGEVAEWSNAPHSKCGIGASLSGVRIPPSPPFLRHSSPQYPIVRIDRKATVVFADFALIPRASCSFSPWVRRTVRSATTLFSSVSHYSNLTAKTTGSAIKAVAASPRCCS